MIAVVLLGVLAGFVWPEIPSFRTQGVQSGTVALLASAHPLPACPDGGTRIAILGDSHVAGSRMGREPGIIGAPFGEVLERELAPRVTVTRYGRGGDTAGMGESRWAKRSIASDWVILAYGTNDAAPRGLLGRRKPVPLGEYRASLRRQIQRWRGLGRTVILIAPPPAGSAAMNQRLAPYRQAAVDAGKAEGVAVLDPAEAFGRCAAAEPLLVHDALHMRAAGHQCLGRWLAQQLCPVTRSTP